MKIERLRNKKSKLIFLCGFLLVVVLLITLVFKGSKAKYRSSQIIPLINTKVKNNVPDFTTMGIFVKNSSGEYEARDTIPSEKGYVINTSKSSCTKFNSATNTSEPVTGVKIYTDTLGKHVIEGISKGSKCYIYFDNGMVLGYNNIATKLLLEWGYEDVSAIAERTDNNKHRTDTGNKIYKAEDNDGWSYYLVGNPENNWVKFGGYYWRIIRINGDGTLRLIYQGRTKDESGNNLAPQTKGAETEIGVSPYSQNGSAEYVGYWYELGNAHGLTTPSKAYTKVNEFYTMIGNEEERKYIDKNAGFCNDRSTVVGNGIGASETNDFFYKRGVSNFKCPNNLDLFTANGAKKGNQKLQYPIGLITINETILGGSGKDFVTPVDNMYTTGRIYRTMSPGESFVHASGYNVSVCVVRAEGYTNCVWGNSNIDVNNNFGIRPVINLVKTVNFSKGNGSISSPFEIN